jgi:hypothetical protein
VGCDAQVCELAIRKGGEVRMSGGAVCMDEEGCHSRQYPVSLSLHCLV